MWEPFIRKKLRSRVGGRGVVSKGSVTRLGRGGERKSLQGEGGHVLQRKGILSTNQGVEFPKYLV